MKSNLLFAPVLAGVFLLAAGFSNAQVSQNSRVIKQSIEVSPLRLLEGNFQLAYERKLNDKWSINFSGMGTYASRGGYGSYYLKSQNEVLSYNAGGIYYSPQMVTGWGAMVQGRNFLHSWSDLPLGMYAAPFLMYRKIWLISSGWTWENDQYIQSDMTRNLDIFEGGVLLGGRIGVIKNIYSMDFNVGAGMRLSKYTNENHFTRFRKWTALDYSGVLPTVGISIGILK